MCMCIFNFCIFLWIKYIVGRTVLGQTLGVELQPLAFKSSELGVVIYSSSALVPAPIN